MEKHWETAKKLPKRNEKYQNIGIASLPRDDDGFFNEREIIRLCGQAKLSLDDLYELYPYEFIFYIEGYLEDQRSYFEYLNYSLFSSIRQSLNDKKKKFENPFEKKKVEESKQSSQKLTEEEYQNEVDAVKEIFNL